MAGGHRRGRPARGAERESKTRFLLRLLARMRQPAIVFTGVPRHARAAAPRSHGRRTRGLRPARRDVAGGAVGIQRRSTSEHTFNRHGPAKAGRHRGAPHILLATDAASEGLNLHRRCRAVVHFELPWSPARLEQRTGRVDRIGQTRRVHEILLIADDTAERLVLAPLAKRAARARSAMPGASRLVNALTESRVASAVMDGELIVAQAGLSGLDPACRPSRRRSGCTSRPSDEARRLRAYREWIATSGHNDVRKPRYR